MKKEIGAVIIFFLTYTLHAITGFAGNALAFPLVSLLLGVSEVKVIMNGVALLSAIFIALVSFREINWKESRTILTYMTAGVCAGYVICLYLPSEDVLLLFYGFFVVIIAGRNFLRQKEKEKPFWWSAIVLLTAGLVQGMFLSGGPVLAIYTAQKIENKKEVRATNNLIMLVIYTCMVILQGIRGEYTRHNVMMIALCAVPLAVGTWLGGKLLDHLDKEAFLKLTYVLLLVLGILLIGRGVSALA